MFYPYYRPSYPRPLYYNFYPYYYGYAWGRPPVQSSSIKQDLKIDIAATNGATVNVNVSQTTGISRPTPRRY